MSSHEIHHLLDTYGVIAVFLVSGGQAVGAPIPGGTVLVAAAIYASTRHGLPVAAIVLAGAVGAFGGTAVAYAICRWRGEQALRLVGRLLRQPEARIASLRTRFGRNAALVLFCGRFITGARNVVGLIAGASAMPLGLFVAVEAAAATLWSASITLEYYFFGDAIVGAATWLQFLLVVAGIAATIVGLRLVGRRVASA